LVVRWVVATSTISATLFAVTVLAAPLIVPLKRELTPADALATVRVMQNQALSAERLSDGLTSPDGQRYLIRLAHGDLKSNGVWMDLLTGRLNSLEEASHPVRCAHLFTTGLGSPASGQSADADVEPTNITRWITPSQVAFLWSNEQAIRQVMLVDLKTCRHRFLTASRTPVFSFAIAQGSALLFNTQVPRAARASTRLWRDGFTLNDAANGWSILNGDIDGTDSVSLGYLNAWFLRSKGRLRRVAIAHDLIDHSNPFYRELSLSPGGRYAIIGTGPARAPESWMEYTSPSLQRLLRSNATSVIKVPVNYTLIDLRDGKSRKLWNVPKDYASQVSWAPDDDRVLLAPTFLPANEHSAAGLAGTAAAVLDIAKGQYAVLPLDLTSRTVTNSRWLSTRAIEITSSNEMGEDVRSQYFTSAGTTWVAVPDPGPDALADKSTPRIQVQIQQDLNHPPQILAIDSKSGDARQILDPNPNLQFRFKLGRVERLSGALSNGRQWIAQLMYPADYEAGRRYPLLIQSLYGHDFGTETFTLDGSWGWNGMGLGPTAFAAYPGQLLATRNIAVLQLEVLHPAPGPQQADDYQLAFETLAQQLSASGLIDRKKIALDGFSRNGYWVEYTLAHSEFPFAAAIAADNYDPSYFPSALFNWRAEDATANGAAAFGDGLRDWLTRAPGFNAEHIHTPLRLIGQSSGIPLIIGQWEIYSRLKHLHRPVEMFMMPSVDTHPSHNPQNPRQIIAVQEGVIDWFSFWLTDREDPAPEKRAQYERWRQMRDSREPSESSEISDPQL
jgi:hypothetical protein